MSQIPSNPEETSVELEPIIGAADFMFSRYLEETKGQELEAAQSLGMGMDGLRAALMIANTVEPDFIDDIPQGTRSTYYLYNGPNRVATKLHEEVVMVTTGPNGVSVVHQRVMGEYYSTTASMEITSLETDPSKRKAKFNLNIDTRSAVQPRMQADSYTTEIF